MADKSQTLAQQYFVRQKEKKTDPMDVKQVEAAVAEKGSTEVIPPTNQSTNSTSDASEVNNDATAEQSSENTEKEENAGDQDAAEETPGIKLELLQQIFVFQLQIKQGIASPDTLNIIAAKGEDAPDCQKFAKYYRSLCPGEWIDRWNEQRKNGTFPGPL